MRGRGREKGRVRAASLKPKEGGGSYARPKAEDGGTGVREAAGRERGTDSAEGRGREGANVSVCVHVTKINARRRRAKIFRVFTCTQ